MVNINRKYLYLGISVFVVSLIAFGYLILTDSFKKHRSETDKIGSPPKAGIEATKDPRKYNDSQNTSIFFPYPENWGEVKTYSGGSGPDPDLSIVQHWLFFTKQPLNDNDELFGSGELKSFILFHNGDLNPFECKSTMRCMVATADRGIKKSIFVSPRSNTVSESPFAGEIDANAIQFRWELNEPSTHPLAWEKLYFIVEYKYPHNITGQNIDIVLSKAQTLDLEDSKVVEFLNNFESYVVRGFSFHPLLIVDSPRYNDSVDARQPIVVTGQARQIFKDRKFNIYAVYVQPNWLPKEGPYRVIDRYIVECDANNSVCDNASENFMNFRAELNLSSAPSCYVSLLFMPGDEIIGSSEPILVHSFGLKGISCK